MSHIVLMRGLPASGKSTHARSLIEKNGNYKRVNRDELRMMIDNGKHSTSKEKYIRKVELAIADLYLAEGFNIIVDDCNLSEHAMSMWREFAREHKVQMEVKDFTDIPVEECIERDRRRPNYVGEQVIRKMYKDFLQVKPHPPAYVNGLPDVVLCDLDGTLALLSGRNPYDASLCEDDLVNEVVRGVLAQCGAYIILVSGRGEQHRPQTERWLMKHAIPYSQLLMRKEDDNRKDAIVKHEIYQQHIEGKYNVKYVLDDRQQCINLWRNLGLIALQVAEGDF
jgi:predicted kinase